MENRLVAAIDKVDTKADDHFRKLMDELHKIRDSDAKMLKRSIWMFFSTMAQVLVASCVLSGVYLCSVALKKFPSQAEEHPVDEKTRKRR